MNRKDKKEIEGLTFQLDMLGVTVAQLNKELRRAQERIDLIDEKGRTLARHMGSKVGDLQVKIDNVNTAAGGVVERLMGEIKAHDAEIDFAQKTANEATKIIYAMAECLGLEIEWHPAQDEEYFTVTKRKK